MIHRLFDRRWLDSRLLLGGWLLQAAPPAVSPPAVSPPAVSPSAVSPSVASPSLDRWIVLRYRGAHLLPDTAAAIPSLASSGTPPRIESIDVGTATDTLWAVHFSAHGQLPTFAVSATVRLTGPTGAVTPLAGRVIARRPFRAPRVPTARIASTTETDWREGWAYLVVLPHAATRTVTRYRGWLLLGVPERVRPRLDERPRTRPSPRSDSAPLSARRPPG